MGAGGAAHPARLGELGAGGRRRGGGGRRRRRAIPGLLPVTRPALAAGGRDGRARRDARHRRHQHTRTAQVCNVAADQIDIAVSGVLFLIKPGFLNR